MQKLEKYRIFYNIKNSPQETGTNKVSLTDEEKNYIPTDEGMLV